MRFDIIIKIAQAKLQWLLAVSFLVFPNSQFRNNPRSSQGIIKYRMILHATGFCILCRPTQPTEASCAALLSSGCNGNILLPQCLLCINRLSTSYWFRCMWPSYKNSAKRTVTFRNKNMEQA